MDFLNKSLAQVKDLFLSMTPGARITAGLLLAVVVISLAYLFHSGVGSGTYLFGGESFPPDEQRAMETAFGKAGLNGFEFEGGRVRVPRGQQSVYIAALAQGNALPQKFGALLEKVLSDANPFRSREQVASAMETAKMQELSKIIGSMNGIDNATVMFGSQTKPGLMKETIHTASVTVKPRGSEALTPELADSIRSMVAMAMAIQHSNIAVTDRNTGRTDQGGPEDAAVAASAYAKAKQEQERQYQEKIIKALAYVPGVIVACDVTLDPDEFHKETEVKYDPKTVPSEVTETSHSRSNDGSASVGGVPGLGSQTAGSNKQMALSGGAGGKGSHEEDEDTSRHEKSNPGGTRIEKETAGLTPKEVKVSVQVPQSYFRKVWEEQNRPEPGQPAKTPSAGDLEQIQTQKVSDIRSCVANLLPRPAVTTDLTHFDPAQLVKVTVFQDIKPDEIPPIPLRDDVLNWLNQYWTTLGLIGLAMVSLVMLRSMVRAIPAAGEAAGANSRAASVSPGGHAGAAAALQSEPEETEKETPAPAKTRRFAVAGGSLKDELSELVSTDPDTAANILRNWIGSG
jgi:flagellar M-ring protein FliF